MLSWVVEVYFLSDWYNWLTFFERTAKLQYDSTPFCFLMNPYSRANAHTVQYVTTWSPNDPYCDSSLDCPNNSLAFGNILRSHKYHKILRLVCFASTPQTNHTAASLCVTCTKHVRYENTHWPMWFEPSVFGKWHKKTSCLSDQECVCLKETWHVVHSHIH